VVKEKRGKVKQWGGKEEEEEVIKREGFVVIAPNPNRR
jgi:hypothetical protein